jgi:hypothetical protein
VGDEQSADGAADVVVVARSGTDARVALTPVTAPLIMVGADWVVSDEP